MKKCRKPWKCDPARRNPARIVRPCADGYEVVAGHRRWRACELAGKPDMPVIIRDLDDDAATVLMVDTNIQRENLLPSEKARLTR